jgi:hypothetical protein
MTQPRRTTALTEVVGRSFFPIAALAVIVGTVWWGPWVTLVLAYGLWRLVARIG